MKVISLYRNSVTIQKALAIHVQDSKDFKATINSTYPKMSIVNRIILHKNVQAEIWKMLGFSMDCPFPVFEESLMYGFLCEYVHGPDMTSIVVSNQEPSGTKCFFELLAFDSGKKVVEFEEELGYNVPEAFRI